MSPETVPAGVIEGGWEYVWAAYALSWAAVLLYAWSLRRRGKRVP